jgi:hypothetical protein
LEKKMNVHEGHGPDYDAYGEKAVRAWGRVAVVAMVEHNKVPAPESVA